MDFLNFLISGLSLGSVYAIIALGYTMVYGIAKMLNFAHGDVIMVGAFITYTICSTAGLSPVLGVVVSIITDTAEYGSGECLDARQRAGGPPTRRPLPRSLPARRSACSAVRCRSPR